jgi:hypothetical protein
MSNFTDKQLEKFRHLLDRMEVLLRDEIAQRQNNASAERGARASAEGAMDPADEASAASLTDTHIAMMNKSGGTSIPRECEWKVGFMALVLIAASISALIG